MKSLTILSLLLWSAFCFAADLEPSGFSLYSGDKFYVLTDGVFGSDENIQVRFEAGGNTALSQYGGVDVRLYKIPKPLEFLKAQKNLHRPEVKTQVSGEGLSNVLSYLWDSWFKKARLSWQRVFTASARKTAVKEVPQLEQIPAHTYKTSFLHENQFAFLKKFKLVDSFRYPVWEAKPNEPPKETHMEGSSSNFIQTQAGNVILPMGKRPPGLYLVEAMIGSFRATTLVFVSNSIVVTKVSSQQALVWTLDRQTGASKAKSHIIMSDGVGVLAQGTAQDDGVFIAKHEMPERSYAMVEDAEGGVSVSENFFYDSEIYQSKIYLFTDRPLYQPGDVVSVRAFGRNLQRDQSKDLWTSLKSSDQAVTTLTILDSSGVELFSQKMPWKSEIAGGEAEFRLPVTAESGGYNLKLKFNGEEYGAAFRVAHYSKPHFDTQIYFDKPSFKVGEPVTGKVALTYSSGEPVVKADVDLQLRAEPMSMYEGSYSYIGSMPVELSQKSYVTNERGEILFRFPAATKPSRYIASARAMDGAAYRVSTKKEILIEGFLETYILSSEFTATEPNKVVKFKYDRQGTDAADNTQALVRWQAIRLEDRTTSFGKVQPTDRGEFDIKFEKEGHYMVRVVDGGGVTRGTKSHVVLGANLKSVTGQLEILADRETYSIGDSAHLILTFPFKADEALLTLERNEVASYGRMSAGEKWFKAKRLNDSQWKIDIPINDSHAPNIIFSVAYARNGEFAFQNKGLIVKTPMIDIRFKTQKASYLPGEKVTVDVQTEFQGKPLESIVAVGVVDEMIYVLQPEIAPPIGEFFHYKRRNQVRTTSSLSFYSFNPATSDVAPAKEASAGRDLKLLEERARRDARDTAYWNGSLKTDSNGHARFEFVMPDALTRWRFTGRAMAASGTQLGAVGESKYFILSKKDFYLKWTGPTRFRTGDKPKPAMVAFNSTRKPADVEILLKGPSYSFSKKINLKPGASTIVLEQAPTQTQNIEAKILVGGKLVDALSNEIEFIPQTWMQQQSKVVRLDKDAKLTLPENATQVRIKVIPDSSYQFLRVADDLLEYPWGCVEQTSSRLIPLTMAVQSLEATGIRTPVTQELRDQIATERRRLVSMAGPDAVFTWWGASTQQNLLVTAHAYHADWRASKLLGITVPKENWEHLLKIYSNSEKASLVDRAYALWVISYVGLPIDEQLKSLTKEIQAAAQSPVINTLAITSSVVMDAPESTRLLASLIVANIALKHNLQMEPVIKNQIEASLKTVSSSAAIQSAALLYHVLTKANIDRNAEAEKILEQVKIETPTIDRAMALIFIEAALPTEKFHAKASTKSIDLGSGWVKDPRAKLATFSWNSKEKMKGPALLPNIPGAVAEASFQTPQNPRSTMNISISRKLYRLHSTSKKDSQESLEAIEVKPNEALDARALYLDELTVDPKAITGRFLLLEVPLPPGGEVDGAIWGLNIDLPSPNFQEARSSASGLGYSIPIDELKGVQKFHQLIRFSSHGQFQLPATRIFKMYRPTEQAIEVGGVRSAVTIQ